MVASLLPGLRDVRTPLAVGYLWLLVGWFVFGDDVPRSDPRDGGVVSRTYELVGILGILGVPAAVAGLSFVAYVIGAIVTLPTEGSLATTLLRRLAPGVHGPGPEAEHGPRTLLQRLFSSADELGTRRAFERRLVTIGEGVAELPADVRRRVGFRDGPPVEAFEPPLTDLRARLLAMNQEMYGEYDRYAAEASFRLNVVPPLLALGAVVAVGFGNTLGHLVVPVCLILLVQGVNRLRQARMVLWRAVITEKITLPAEDHLQEARQLVAHRSETVAEPGGTGSGQVASSPG
ncbi:hypothetical protein [Geodermatophilus sp. SYSU D01176]